MDARNGRLRRFATAFVSVAVFVLALHALYRLGGEFHLRDVLAEFAAIAPWRACVAVMLAAVSYLALAGYERLALDYVGHSMRWRQYATTSFIANSIGYNIGIAAVTGGAVRYRLYASLGLGATEIAKVVAFCTVTFLLGLAALGGASLVARSGAGASLLHASAGLSRILGVSLLALVLVYLAACRLRPEVGTWRGWRLPLPSLRLAIMQLLVACADLLAACGCLYVLLPPSADVQFTVFAGIYMVALAAGMASGVPGGLGVIESTLVLLLPTVPTPQMLGALLAYRLVYYLLPFAMALVLLSTQEAARRTGGLGAALDRVRKPLGLVVPQAMAMMVFGAGLLLLVSGAIPGSGSRLATLGRFLPLPVLELSHLTGSAVGVLLLILARGLHLRLDGAWRITVWMLGAGIAASLLRGLDYAEALLLAAVLLPLWSTRAQFYRKASLLARPLSPGWVASAAVAIGASVWVGMLAHRHLPYANELWWQFALDANAPRMLRASLLAVLLLGSYATLRLLAPVRAPPSAPSASDLERALPIIRASTQCAAQLALLGDKSLLFSRSGNAFLMYARSRRSWVAMGDPVGPPEEYEELVWRFLEIADQAGAWAVFYEVSTAQLQLYVDAGLALSKLGEEARVSLPDFSLEGSARAKLRQAHGRAGRDGLAFRIVPAGDVPSLMPTLRRISDEWLAAKSTAEKGFSLGRFSEAYLRHFPIAVVEHHGAIVAFANVLESGAREEMSVDLMRHGSASPYGVMDFLFIELMLWGKTQGYRWFSLGMAPLAGLEAHRLAPAWHKVGHFVYRHGEEFYNFEGLRLFKDKFLPEWRPRYLAAPGRLALPGVLFDVTALISGSLTDSLPRHEKPGGTSPRRLS